MCRFVMYLGPRLPVSALVTEPDHSLIHQSVNAAEREEPLNGDGFGIAWYVPELPRQPGLFKSITPAWSNANLQRLAPVTMSTCILAHVRAATQGTVVSEVNCHPFVRSGVAFMHNGDLGGFHKIRRALLNSLSDEAFESILGTTDSEHLFALIGEELDRASCEQTCERLTTALVAGVERALALVREAGVEEHSYLNIAMADGRNAVACRFTTDAPEHVESLYLNTGRRYVCEDGVCRMLDTHNEERAVIVSSERLSDDPGWSPIPANHIVIIRGGQVNIEPWPGADALRQSSFLRTPPTRATKAG